MFRAKQPFKKCFFKYSADYDLFVHRSVLKAKVSIKINESEGRDSRFKMAAELYVARRRRRRRRKRRRK